MGTLTADSSRLPGFCEHKLPTSCRLSSIPGCCACSDERAHSAAYSVYIDGIGYVPRGTRWQRYCWFCKEFWENRVTASGIRPAQTRIPDRPDQTEFLERWYEFHQGFRIVKKEDGTEERVAVLGEPWRDVSPGYLPRTLEELRAGAERNAMAASAQELQELEAERQAPAGPSLDEALDQMFQDAAAEEEQQTSRSGRVTVAAPAERANIHAQAMNPASSRNREYQARRVAALRRELHRMRNGIERVISGLRELGENVPDSSEATGSLTDLGRTLDSISGVPSEEIAARAISSVNDLTTRTAMTQTDRTLANMQARVDEARQHMEEARRARDQAATELDVADQEFRTTQERLRQSRHEQRTAENYMRLFGTREEMNAQGEDYVSPIGDMFSRAYDRFRAAEEVRREERTLRRVLQDESRGGEHAVRRLSELESYERDVWGVPRPSQQQNRTPLAAANADNVAEPQGDEVALEEYYAMMRRQHQDQRSPDVNESSQPAAENGVIQENFPRNMLQAVIAARERRINEQNNAIRRPLVPIIDPLPSGESARLEALFGPDGSVRTPDDLQIEDLVALLRRKERTHGDVEEELDYLLIAVSTDETLRSAVNLELEDVRRIMAGRLTTISSSDRELLQSLRHSSTVIWQSGLPARRLRYLRSAGFDDVLYRDPVVDEDIQGIFDHNNRIEYLAEAFQMSSEFRRTSGLTPPAQLQTLYRLQAGRRDVQDVDLLRSVPDNQNAMDLARRAHDTTIGQTSATDEAQRSTLDQQRRQSAQEGDHSREELNAQRRATHAFAAAAGRLAMQTGPAALLEQLADRDPGTRAAYQRLQENWAANGETPFAEAIASQRPGSGLVNLSDAFNRSRTRQQDEEDEESEEEEDEEVGLDDPTSGRPAEPLDDEAMNVRMDCRICYTQVAEIACLPCGHLVMCRWCSEQHSPVMTHDRTRPRRAAGCPACRKGIRQKVRVFRP